MQLNLILKLQRNINEEVFSGPSCQFPGCVYIVFHLHSLSMTLDSIHQLSA